MDRGAWRATVHGVERVGHDLATKLPPPLCISSCKVMTGSRDLPFSSMKSIWAREIVNDIVKSNHRPRCGNKRWEGMMIAGIPGESHTAATRREARTCWRQGGNYHFTTKNQSTLDYRALLKRKEPTLINLKYIFIIDFTQLTNGLKCLREINHE